MTTKLLNQNLNDHTPFWGVKVTPELKFLQQIFNNKVQQVSVTKSFYREILKCKSNQKYYQSYQCWKIINLKLILIRIF